MGCFSVFFAICFCREGVEKVLGELSMFLEELVFGKIKIFIRSFKIVSWRVYLFLVGMGGGRVREFFLFFIKRKFGGEGSIYNLEWRVG